MDLYEFYQDTNILVTGGTGFVGKVLIEKLLRSCDGIKTINILVRPKKGLKETERLNELLKCQVSHDNCCKLTVKCFSYVFSAINQIIFLGL